MLYLQTIYTHPATHSISELSGLQTALDGKVDDSQVLTDVPTNAVFTDKAVNVWDGGQFVNTDKIWFDNSQIGLSLSGAATGAITITTEPSISQVSGLQTALDGKIDDSQVLTNVPANASFTDTIYTHPATHSISEISGLQTSLNDKVDDSQVLTNVPANALFTDKAVNVWDGSQFVNSDKLWFDNSQIGMSLTGPTIGAITFTAEPSISQVSGFQTTLNHNYN